MDRVRGNCGTAIAIRRANAALSAKPRSLQLALQSVVPLCLCLLASSGFAQSHPSAASTHRRAALSELQTDPTLEPLNPSPLAGAALEQILQRAAAQGSRFLVARNRYTYRRRVEFDTIAPNERIDGRLLRVDDIVFDSIGRKHEQSVYAPTSTLTRVAISPADLSDVEHRLPFMLTKENWAEYRSVYEGRQTVDGMAAYVFRVTPKRIQPGDRYFSGRIWIDAKDHEVVLVRGRGVPDDTIPGQQDLSLPFTTRWKKIDGVYRFPVYTRAEGMLRFRSCRTCAPDSVRVRETVLYSSYKRFGTNVRIVFDGRELPNDTAWIGKTPSGP
jgi:hypothetical protein